MLPHYLSIGISYKEFMHSTPKVLKAYDKAHFNKIELIDSLVWQLCGNYILSSVAVAVEHCLAGRKAQSEYVKEPMFADLSLSDEEKEKKELDKFIKGVNAMQGIYKNK